eukprot:NODE_564_length_5986_cov_1.209614.p2 type:complete len:742 gc:universal NODE_564_length_5986_cov_1.209614:4955-2730(-)
MAEAEQVLNKAVLKKELTDLHTHLKGMGNSDFWVNEIMRTYLPNLYKSYLPKVHDQKSFEKAINSIFKQQYHTISDHSCDDFNCPNKLYHIYKENTTMNENSYLVKTNLLSPNDLELVKKMYQIKVLENNRIKIHKDDFYMLFTSDVVYWSSLLLDAFGIDRNDPFYLDKLEQTFQGLSQIAFESLEEIEEYKKGNKRQRTSSLEKKRYLEKRDDFLHLYRFHIIFHSKSGQLELVRGISNQVIYELLSKVKASCDNNLLLNKLKNGFSLLNEDGSTPQQHTMHPYQSNFTPKFFPQRFALKDCILECRLEVFSILLNHVLSNYSDSGVHYVEFSISATDLLNVFAWRHLVKNLYESSLIKGKFELKRSQKKGKLKSNAIEDMNEDETLNEEAQSESISEEEQTKSTHNEWPSSGKIKSISTPFWRKFVSTFKRLPTKMHVRFIAAFNRSNNCEPNSSFSKIIEYWQQNEPNWHSDNFLECIKSTSKYDPKSTKFLQKLSNFCDIVGQSQFHMSDQNHLQFYFRQYVCGLDLAGDELYAPQIDFSEPKCLVLVKKICDKMTEGNTSFGIRIHGAENVPISQPHYFFGHTLILFKDLYVLVDSLKENPNVTFRIGHGVSLFEDNTSLKDNYLIRNIIYWLSQQNIPLEINITSNLFLLPGRYSHTMDEKINYLFRKLKENNISSVISTDDDGIWNLSQCEQHLTHNSVAHEFCKAIHAGALNAEDVVQHINNGYKFAFSKFK